MIDTHYIIKPSIFGYTIMMMNNVYLLSKYVLYPHFIDYFAIIYLI